MKIKTFILTFLIIMSCPFLFGQSEWTEVSSASGLKTALQAGGNVKVTLPIFVNEMITIPEGVEVTLDLNGNSLMTDESNNVYIFRNNGIMTIKDSSTTGTGMIKTRGIAVGEKNNSTLNANAHLTIENGTFYAHGTDGGGAVYNYANVTINGGTFIGDYVAISNLDGGNITVKDAYIESFAYAAIVNKGAMTLSEETEITGAVIDNNNGITDEGATYYRVKIGEVVYSTLQKALDAATVGTTTIEFIVDLNEDATVSQEEGKNIIIDGKDNDFSGSILIKGNSRNEGTETLTIQNINFTTDEESKDFIHSHNDNTIIEERYAHNVTIKDCNFEATATNNTVVATRFRQAYNVSIEGCTFDNMFLGMWGTGISGVNIENVDAVGCIEGGFSFATSTDITVSDATIQSENGYGLRADASVTATMTVENSTISAAMPVFVRYATADYNLEFNGTNTMTAGNEDGTWCLVTANNSFTEPAEPAAEHDILIMLNDEGLDMSGVEGAVAPMAKIGDVYYASLQNAINAAKNGDEIVLQSTCNENVTVEQAVDYAVTINGNNNNYRGTITIDGQSAAYPTSAVTIKNFKFNAFNVKYDACIRLGDGTNPNRYTSNVTVDNCNFNGNYPTKVVVAVKSYTGGDKNLVITNCTANNMHSLTQLKNVSEGLKITDCTVEGQGSAISLGNSVNSTITGCTIDVDGYGIRVDAEVADNSVTIADCKIDAFIPVVVRNVKGDYDLVFNGENTMTQRNTDDVWCAIGKEEYEENGKLPTIPDEVRNVVVVLNDEGLSMEGVYGAGAPMAKIGDVYYASLQNAINAAKNDDEITLLGDAEGSHTLQGKNITLDLNGNTVTSDDITISVLGGELIVVDNSTEKSGKIISTHADGNEVVAVKDNGKFTLNSGNIEGASYGVYLYKDTGGAAIINGGSITLGGAYKDGMIVAVASDKCSLTVTDGTFTANGVSWPMYTWGGPITLTGGTYDYRPVADYIKPGYMVVEGADGRYTIVEKGIYVVENETTSTKYNTLAEAFAAVQPNGLIEIRVAGEYTWPTTEIPAGVTVTATVDGVVATSDGTTRINAKEVLTVNNIDFIAINHAAQVTNGKAENLTFTNCSFTGVYAFHVDAAAAGAELNFNNCQFNGFTTFATTVATINVVGGSVDGSFIVRQDVSMDEVNFIGDSKIQIGTSDVVKDAELSLTDCTVNGAPATADLINPNENGSEEDASNFISIDGDGVLGGVALIGDVRYKTLADAIEDATDGTTIAIRDGITYDESATLVHTYYEFTFTGYAPEYKFPVISANDNINITNALFKNLDVAFMGEGEDFLLKVTGAATNIAGNVNGGKVVMNNVTMSEETDVIATNVEFIGTENTLAGSTVEATNVEFKGTKNTLTGSTVVANILVAEGAEVNVNEGAVIGDQNCNMEVVVNGKFVVTESLVRVKSFDVALDATLSVNKNSATQHNEFDFYVQNGFTNNGNSTFNNGAKVYAKYTNVSKGNAGATLNVVGGSYFKTVGNSSHTDAALKFTNAGTINVFANSTLEIMANTKLVEGANMHIYGTVINHGANFEQGNGAIDLAAADATLTAQPGLTVTTNIADHKVVYEGGKYQVAAKVYIAQIGDNKYESVAEAIAAVEDGQKITLIENTPVVDETKVEIAFDKDIEFTITGIAPSVVMPIVTYENATVNIVDATFKTAELDVRQDATVNVVNSTVYDAGGNSIVKSYYNGKINITNNSTVYAMQVTTMGYINIDGTSVLNATWQTNVYGNGMLTVSNGATFNTAALQLTGKDYSGRDNTDAERVGQPALITVDHANFTVGSVKSSADADYSYHSSYGINVGTEEGKFAILDIKNGANVKFYMAETETPQLGAGGTINLSASTFEVICRKEGATIAMNNNGAINVTGASTIDAKFTGEGLVNMNAVALDANTIIEGANVAFVGAQSTVTASQILGNVTVAEGITVNVEDAKIGKGSYNATVNGTLNIDETLAVFSGLTIAENASLNVTGHAATQQNGNDLLGSITNNGTVVIDGANVRSMSSAVTSGAEMQIINGSKYESLGTGRALDVDGKLTVDEESTLNLNTKKFEFDATATLNLNGTVISGDVTAKAGCVINMNALTATFTTPTKGLAIGTEVADAKIVYEGGMYKVVEKVYVAQVNEGNKYETLTEALENTIDGDVINLIAPEGVVVEMTGEVTGGKTVTITGTATVDWTKGWLFVGRGENTGNGTLIFDEANLTSTGVNSEGFGLNVSGNKEDDEYVNDGIVVIEDSEIELDYMINRHKVEVKNSILDIAHGLNVYDRSGLGAYAVLSIEPNSVVTVADGYQTTIGHDNEGHGLVDVKENSTFNIGSLNIGRNGALCVDETSTVNGGNINLSAAVDSAKAGLYSAGNVMANITADDSADIILFGGTYVQDVNDWCDENYGAFANGNGTWTVRLAKGTQTVQLTAGWNWFSSYMSAFDGEAGLDALTKGLDANGIEIKSANKFTHNMGDAYGGWMGSLEETSVEQMYKLHVKVAQELTLEFTDPSFVQYEDLTITLYPGWNYIGYPVCQEISLNDALSNLDANDTDIIKTLSGSATYFDPWGGWIEDGISTLVPGVGYMYYNSSNDVKQFKYSNKVVNSTSKSDLRYENYHWNADASQYSSNMNIIAMLEVDGEFVKGNYEVAAFANGECRGSARPIYIEEADTYILVLTVYGDEVEELTFKYYDITADAEYELSNRVLYSNDAILGSAEEPYMFNRDIMDIGETLLSEIKIYPNPTTIGREVNLQATCDKVEVYNTLGVKVAEYHNVDSIDAFETAGIYIIRMTNNGDVKHTRLVVR